MNLQIAKLFLILTYFYSTNGIRNGEIVFQNSARYIASIRLRSLEQQTIGSGFLCTASLINSRHAITAATCVTNFLVSELQSVLGVENINSRNSGAVIRDIQRMHFHPNFNRTSESRELNGNVAILQFFISIRQSTSRWSILEYSNSRNFHVQPIKVSELVLDSSSICQFYSWSNNPTSYERIPDLLGTSLAIVNNNECLNSESIFCAHKLNETEPILCGNLGGAFICNNTLYGISTRNVCDEIGHFVLLPYYSQWISAVSKSNSLINQNVFELILTVIVLFLITLKIRN